MHDGELRAVRLSERIVRVHRLELERFITDRAKAS
jgi:hypothetical protein